MKIQHKSDSPAVAVAVAHIEAWSNQDFNGAQRLLAPEVRVAVTTTQPIMAATQTVGVQDYMEGLKKFLQIVVPGSAEVVSALGDKNNALVTVIVKARFGPSAPEVTLPAARLYLLDDAGKILSEQVIFYVTPTPATR